MLACLSFHFHFRDDSSGFPAQTDSNKWLLLCMCCICLFGLNLLSGSGRDGHGDEWRTSCSEREAGTAKKSRTGQLKHLDHASLPFSLFRHQRLQLPPFHFARYHHFARQISLVLQIMHFSMWFLPVHLINLCFCCFVMTCRPVVETECRPNPWSKEWLRSGTPDGSSELQVEFFSACASFPCGLRNLMKRADQLICCAVVVW